MTINFNNLIEKYILGKLKGKKLEDFRLNMEQSPELAFEVQFNVEMAEAISESNIMNLRSSMQSIFEPLAKQPKQQKGNLFDLSQNLDPSKISKTANADITNIENSLQFIHLENHKKNQTERIHVIKPENSTINIQRERFISDNDLWQEISDSLKEKDIIELRNNLKQITSTNETELNDYQIDQYLDQDLSTDVMMEIESMINNDQQIAAQVELHKEINSAINENDIFNLRATINSIVEEEQSISYSEIKRIDEYLLNYLNDKEQLEFEEQLFEDLRLKSELDLNSEINGAILEEDIMNLRGSLSDIIHEDKADTKIRQFIPDTFRKSPSRMIGAAASIAAVISVGAMTLSNQKLSSQEIYNNAYKPYEATGLYRSPVSVTPEILGVDLYNNQKYKGALDQFDKVLNANPDHPMCNFYSGLSYQQLQEYSKAINSYQKVIDEKDNLFIEQAEWYMALCYLKTNDESKAYSTFNAILDKKGYYSKDVKEIIKKLK